MVRGSTARAIAGTAPCLVLALLACAATPRPAGEHASLRIAVAPPNLAIELPNELAVAVEPVQQEILRYLVASGARVELVWPPDARQLWRQAVLSERGGGGGEPSLTEAAGEFARTVSDETGADFDLLVLPSLAYRKARVFGQRASWDGVGRELGSVGRGASASTTTDQYGWRPDVAAISLHVLVLRRDGRVVGQAWGGLELAPFDGLEHVREGVAIALEPFVR